MANTMESKSQPNFYVYSKENSCWAKFFNPQPLSIFLLHRFTNRTDQHSIGTSCSQSNRTVFLVYRGGRQWCYVLRQHRVRLCCLHCRTSPVDGLTFRWTLRYYCRLQWSIEVVTYSCQHRSTCVIMNRRATGARPQTRCSTFPKTLRTR